MARTMAVPVQVSPPRVNHLFRGDAYGGRIRLRPDVSAEHNGVSETEDTGNLRAR